MRRLALVAALCLVGCGKSSSPPRDEPVAGEGVVLPDGKVFTRKALLEATAGCVVAEARAFEGEAGTLATRAAALASDPARREAAEDAWRAAIDRWQRLEQMQIGPAATSTLPGGMDIRDEIYAWPLTSPCAVDQGIVAAVYDKDEDVLVNARGLGAVEYLLFHTGAGNGCSAADAINSEGSWAALDAQELDERRRRYVDFASAIVRSQASRLVSEWEGGFTDELVGAGEGSRTFGKQRIALNAVSDAMFYVEWATKDLKLARPAGLTGCETSSCPDEVESRFAHRSKEHVKNNLVGLRMLFTGCGEVGFDDFLIAVGAASLASELEAAIADALAAVEAIDEPDLVTAIAEDRQSVVAAHAALKRVTDLLRTQFVSLLDLELPQRVEGDND